jgi:DUF971 family protein
MASPDQIKRVKDDSGKGIGLELVWSGGPPVLITAKKLRDSCPCATCEETRGKQTHANPLGTPRTGRALLQVVEATKDEGYELKKVWGIGNYAVGLAWGDGHDSGIYSYPILRELSKSA